MDDITKDKLNNFHFRKHVFEYFPWNTYDNKNLIDPPKFDRRIYNGISGQFHPWTRTDGGFYCYVSPLSLSSSTTSMFVNKNDYEVVINGIVESISDWEDIEKIKLRYQLGSKKKADVYKKKLDFYEEYYDNIDDIVYTQNIHNSTDSTISMLDMGMWRGSGYEGVVANPMITDEMVLQSLAKNQHKNSFLSSVHGYYKKMSMITTKQMDAVKSTLCNDIISDMYEMPLIHIEIDGDQDISRITSYLLSIGIKFIEVSDKMKTFIIVYPEIKLN